MSFESGREKDIYKRIPGIGESEFTEADKEGNYKEIKRGQEAGEVIDRELPEELKPKEQNSLDMLKQEDREKILEEADIFAEGHRGEFVGYSIPEQDAEILEIKLKEANELAYNKLKKK